MPGIGQSNPNPLPLHGTLWFDARDYGFSTANADNTPAVQAAHDAAVAANVPLSNALNNPIATVFLPAAKGTYTFRSPVWADGSYVEFRGEGGSTQLQMANGCGFPLFVVGFPRGARSGGGVPDSTYRPDLFGKLDTAAAPAANQRWGLRTRTDLGLTSFASHFSHGVLSTIPGAMSNACDKYSETNKLTIEFAIEGFSSGQVPANANILGLGTFLNNGAPLPTSCFQVLTQGANQYFFALYTQSARFAVKDVNYYTFNTGAATGVQRIAVQVDCTTNSVSVIAATGGGAFKQLAVTHNSGPGIAAGSTICENSWDAFTINNNGTKAYTGAGTDFAIYGLRLTRSVPYTTPGVGSTVARVDGKAISDLTRYFPSDTDDPNLIGYLGFTEDPATAPRHLAVSGLLNLKSSAFLYNAHTLDAFASLGVRFADLNINADRRYGSAIAQASTIDTRVDRVWATGGAYAMNSIATDANYVHRYTDCKLGAWDAAIMTYASIVVCDGLSVSTPGLAGFRLVDSTFRARGSFVFGTGSPQIAAVMVHSDGYASTTYFDALNVDNESLDNLLCGFYVERAPNAISTFRLTDTSLGGLGDVPCVMLRGQGIGFPAPTGVVAIDGLQGSFRGAVVEMDDPTWAGIIRNATGVRASHASNVGAAPGRVVVEDTNFVSPPHFGSWYRNNSRFLVPGAADGQYREIGVVAGGAMGSATPPQFVGRRPEQSSPNALALYATDHTAIAATLSGRASSWGQPTDFAVCAMAQAMFSQTLPGTPANYKVVLSVQNANRSGTYFEPDGSTGYRSATIANSSASFTAASAGSKASSVAINFGTFTAAVTIKSIALVDPATGQPWASIQLASPLVVGVGVAPTIASGALTFTHTPLPGPQFSGCLTDFAWGKLWDYAFRGTSFTAPTTFYAALTTAAASKATTTLVEPSGNGYARVAATNDATRWSVLGAGGQQIAQQFGDGVNIAALAFPAPTGPWGTAVAAGLTDASSAGNVWAVAPLTNPVSPSSGTTAPTFAAGAFVVAVG